MSAEQVANSLTARLTGCTLPATATVWLVVAIPIPNEPGVYDVTLKVQGANGQEPDATILLHALLSLHLADEGALPLG